MTNTVTLGEVHMTSPIIREVNRGLMVKWINDNLLTRAHHDVRHSIVIYDEDYTFMGAINPDDFKMHQLTDGIFDSWHELGVRHWSKGIV